MSDHYDPENKLQHKSKCLQHKSKCLDCGWIGDNDDVLTAPNPFDAYSDESIEACPKCKTVENMAPVCDEPGCKREANCGTPTPAGYRHTCSKHAPPFGAKIGVRKNGGGT